MNFLGKMSFEGFEDWQGHLALLPNQFGSFEMSLNRYVGIEKIFLAYDRGGGWYSLQASNGGWVFFTHNPPDTSIRSSTVEFESATRFAKDRIKFDSGESSGAIAWEDTEGRWSVFLRSHYEPSFRMVARSFYGGSGFKVRRPTPGVEVIRATGAAVGADFKPVGAAQVDLSEADLSRVDFTRAQFEGAILDGTRLAGATLDGAGFQRVVLIGTDFQGASFFGTDFTGGNLTQAVLSDPPGFSRDVSRRTRLARARILFDTLKKDWSYLDLEDATIVGLSEAPDLAGLQAHDALLPDLDLSDLELPDARFERSVLHRTSFKKSTVTDAVFDRAELQEAHLQEADLTRSSFRSAILVRALLSRAKLIDASFEIDLANPDRRPTDLTGADLAFADLTGAKLIEAFLIKAILTGADLSKANLTGAQLGGRDRSLAASLSFAYLANVIFERANLFGVSFSGATLFGASSSLADAATLELASFANAYLAGIDLSGVNLKGARLDGACLVNVQFKGTSFAPTLSGSVRASLAGATLQGADFSGADLAGADLANAAVAFQAGEIPVRHCDAQGEPFPPPPDTLLLRHPATLGLDLETMKEDTVCPNGHTVRNNLDQDRTLEQMLTSKEAPTSWFPKACRPREEELGRRGG